MVIKFNMFLSPMVKILFFGHILNVHLIIITSSFSNVIISFILSGQVTLLYSVTLPIHLKHYSHWFKINCSWLTRKINPWSYTIHLLFLLKHYQLNPPAPLVSQRWNFSTTSKDWPFNSIPGLSNAASVSWIVLV